MNAINADVAARSIERHRAPPASEPIRVRGTRPRDLRYCRECGNPFWPSRHDHDFCKPGCRTAFHKRRYERGAELYDFAMEWRGKRLKGKFTEFCQIIDEWLRDEREREQVRQAVREAYQHQLREGR